MDDEYEINREQHPSYVASRSFAQGLFASLWYYDHVSESNYISIAPRDEIGFYHLYFNPMNRQIFFSEQDYKTLGFSSNDKWAAVIGGIN